VVLCAAEGPWARGDARRAGQDAAGYGPGGEERRAEAPGRSFWMSRVPAWTRMGGAVFGICCSSIGRAGPLLLGRVGFLGVMG